ncbi:MAG TPA: HAMP domain-containing sensor histidine kinase [Chitinispirillaceae bacterium]|nr:HAMP domain-containing histidine kinase [Fibrobacter sp.]HLV33399.1 HAMP domain-containing sensor histidine kinase [Chitinispirillaceae bacterium]
MNKKPSLFTKLTVLITISVISIAFTTHVAIYSYLSDIRNKTPLHENFHQLAKYLVTQIDISDTAATRSFLENQLLDLRYIGDNFEWSSSKDIPDLNTAMKKISDKKLTFWHHNRLATVVETGNAIHILQGISPFEQLSFPWKIFTIWFIILMLIFGFAHRRIRRLLYPVRILQNGLKKISYGKFDTQLPVTSNDELGQLVKTFNTMACQINNDIKSRDQLLRDISHELRSPLSRMLVALEFVPEGNIRQTLRNNITILEKMTSSILEEERLESPFGRIKNDQINLKKLICEIVENRKNYKSSIDLKNNEDLFIRGDEERLRMAVSNVIDNAIKYSKSDKDPVEIEYFQTDNETKIIIRDYGIGIPESEIPFIFEPFYRIDKARQHKSGGYGLGMSLTKKVITAHNGSISITSATESGTVVTIKIPTSHAPKL